MKKKTRKQSAKQKALNSMVKILCKKEKGKKELNAGQAREIIKLFTVLSMTDIEFSLANTTYRNSIHEEIFGK